MFKKLMTKDYYAFCIMVVNEKMITLPYTNNVKTLFLLLGTVTLLTFSVLSTETMASGELQDDNTSPVLIAYVEPMIAYTEPLITYADPLIAVERPVILSYLLGTNLNPLSSFQPLPPKIPYMAQSDEFLKATRKGGVVPIAKQTYQTTLFRYGYLPRNRSALQRTFFYLDRIRLGLRLRYEFKDEVYTYSNRETKTQYHKFAERFSFVTGGWIYNPDLFHFNIKFEPNFSQLSEEYNNETDSLTTFSPDYNFTATLFDRTPFGIHLFSSLSETTDWGAFKGYIETNQEQYGADVDLDFIDLIQKSVPGRLHSNLGYRYSNTSTSGFYQMDTEEHRFTFRSNQYSDHSDGRLNIKYVDREESRNVYDTTTSYRYEALDTDLSHYYYFGSNTARSHLASALTYWNHDNNGVSTEIFRITESAYLFHRPQLQSKYLLKYNFNKYGINDSHNFRANASLHHKLFENLDTSTGIRSSYSYTDTSSTLSVNPFLDWKYVRDIPMGKFYFMPGWSYDVRYQDQTGSDQGNMLGYENIILQIGIDQRLQYQNIDTSTIIVTSQRNFRVYTANIDYEVIQNGSYTLLRLLPFSAISDQEPLKVSYQYSTDTTFNDGLLNQHYGLRFNLFESLDLYYNYSQVSQHIISGTEPLTLSDYKYHIAEVVYNFGNWSTSKLHYEIRDTGDSGSSSDSMYFKQDLRFSFLSNGNLTLGGKIGTTEYEDSDLGSNDYYNLSLSLNWRFARWCSFNFSGFYSENESATTDTTNFGVDAGLLFSYRIWQAKLYYYYLSQESQRFDSNDSQQREKSIIRFDIIRLTW